MTKKRNYELFGRIIHISDEDEKRLSLSLKNWNVLHEFLSNSANYTMDELRKMIVIEREGLNRFQIINRLHGRLTSTNRDEQKKELGI